MAYGDHYRIGYSSHGTTGYINIWEDGYSGSVEDLTLIHNSLKIDYKPNGWENPIIGLAASFGILNDEASYFTLLPLLTATEKQYWVRVTRVSPSSLTLFEGFVVCNNNEQKYLKNRTIRIVASSYLSKLQYVTPPDIETLQTISFIDYLDDCLRQTGTEQNIRVNSSLYPTGDTIGSTSSLFNKAGVYSEVFHKNNIDKDNALEVITKILSSFDCFIYWYNENWYIERYDDIYNATTQSYVEYTTGTSYGPSDTGSATSTSLTPIDFQDLTPIGQSQTIGVIQGMKEIEVKVDQIRLFNFTVNDFGDDNIAAVTSGVPDPDLRTWEYWNSPSGIWPLTYNGSPWKNISNSIKRSGWFGTYDYHRGMYTKFKVTVDSDVSLNIKFKYASIKGSFGSWTNDWEDFSFIFNWYLRDAGTSYYIYYNSGTDTWTRDSGTESTKLNQTTIAGTEFDDGNVSCEVSITIPLGSVTGLSGDEELILCVGTEEVDRPGANGPASTCWYGDCVITASGSLTDNNYKGVISTTMLNKLSVTLPFSDIQSLNLKNGIFRGTSFGTRTTTWTDDGTNVHTLAIQKIRSLFRLYRIPRQRITAKISTTEFYRPLRNFEDSEQSGKQYILFGFTYFPERDQMQIILMEYDNTETVTAT